MDLALEVGYEDVNLAALLILGACILAHLIYLIRTARGAKSRDKIFFVTSKKNMLLFLARRRRKFLRFCV